MTRKELTRLAAGTNPYVLAYALETGAESAREALDRDGGDDLFALWNEARWVEQAADEKGLRRFVSTDEGACDRHLDRLAARLP